MSGNIDVTNAGDTAQFDIEMLQNLDPVTIETSTIWTEGTQTFTGVPLGQLMDLVGTDSQSVQATAVNDYAVTIPIEDWQRSGAIVAFHNNGAPMSLRKKGPLWVIYPYDSNPEFQTEVIYSRSIWQLDRIVVE